MHAICLCFEGQNCNIWECLWIVILKVLRKDILELPASIFKCEKTLNAVTLWKSPHQQGAIYRKLHTSLKIKVQPVFYLLLCCCIPLLNHVQLCGPMGCSTSGFPSFTCCSLFSRLFTVVVTIHSFFLSMVTDHCMSQALSIRTRGKNANSLPSSCSHAGETDTLTQSLKWSSPRARERTGRQGAA